MWTGERSASRRFLVAAIAALTIPVLAVGVLGWMLIGQEAELADRRAAERPRAAVELAASAVTRAADAIDQQLRSLLEVEPVGDRLTLTAASSDGTVAALIDGRDIWTSTPLPFHPDRSWVRAAPDGTADLFLDAERLEYTGDLAGALAAYRSLAAHASRSVRAGALVRVGRAARRLGRQADALEAYRALLAFGTTPVFGQPAELLAQLERCDLLHELGRRDELIAAAREFDRGLVTGRWLLSRDEFDSLREEISTYVDTSPPDAAIATRILLAHGVARAAELAAAPIASGDSGHATFDYQGDSGIIIWRRQSPRAAVFVAATGGGGDSWLPDLRAIERVQGVRLTVADASGRRWFGDPPGPLAQSTTVDGLPFVVSATAVLGPGDDLRLGSRRSLIVGIVVAFGMLMLVGGYVSARGINRELAAARLQSDFVAAVSHEFRTPVASVLQLSELLDEGRVPDASRRAEYYGLLRRESLRLQRLVENLLDFGRMEASAVEYRMEVADVGALVRDVTGTFADEVRISGREVVVNVGEGLPDVRADREAIGRALWNLLDNAAKYSPPSASIDVEARATAGGVDISVRDRGPGIPLDEQPAIFDRFVRGAQARASGAKGTGLGLAMVKHIVTAHHGTVSVASDPGAGAVFTIRLPTGDTA